MKDAIIAENRRLSKAAWFTWAGVVIVQIVLIITFTGQQYGDFGQYVNMALNSLRKKHFFYPYEEDLYVWYLHAPGYINFLILLFRLGLGLYPVYITNTIFIHVMLFSCKYIVHIVSGNKNSADWFQVIFCLYSLIGMNSGIVQANTEIMFAALLFAAFVVLIKCNIFGMIIVGIILALANWIRPTIFLFIPMIVWIVLIERDTRKKAIKKLSVLGLSYVLAIMVIGLSGYIHCGKFVYKSTTSGINLLVGNNPDADGNNTFISVKKGGVGYVGDFDTSEWTYENYQEYWKNIAVDWMIHNPGKVIRLIPRKYVYQWAVDTYWCRAYSNNEKDADTGEYYLSILEKVMNGRFSELTLMDVLTGLHEMIYILVLLSFVVSVIKQIRRRDIMKYWGLYSVIILGGGLNCIMHGSGRFHFIYMPIMIMLTSLSLEEWRNKSREAERVTYE